MSRVASDFRPVRTDLAFGCLVFATICLQKFALPSGEFIGVPVIALWGVLLWLMSRGVAFIDPFRAALFGIILFGIVLSMLIERQMPRGPNPLILMLVMYATLMFRIDVDHSMMLRCLNQYQRAILLVALYVIVQQLIQYSIGNSYWPNLEKMAPKDLLVPGYMYIRPVDGWDTNYLTPNGFFFLEPSGVSLCLAAGVASEIVWFKRPMRVIVIAMAMLVSMAGTGIVILSLLSPFLLRKMDPRLRNWIIGIGMPVVVLAVAFGAFSHLSDRSSELGEKNSSGHGRLIAPFEDTVMLASDPTYIFNGNGPGTAAKAGDLTRSDDAEVQWPADKLIYEYGLLTAIAFHIYLIMAAFRSSPSPVLAAVVFIPHMCFGGGFVVPTNIVLLIIFCTLLRLKLDEGLTPVRASPSPRYRLLVC
jgi:hypothetical protein